MPEIRITVQNKIAQTVGKPVIVCGNSDYTLFFETDDEWTPYDGKTARFFWYDNRQRRFLHTDVLFEGNAVTAPVLRDTNEVIVGIFAGALHTSAPVRIPCQQAVTDGADIDEPPAPLYVQLLSYLQAIAQETAVRQTALAASGVSGIPPVHCIFAPPEEQEVEYGNP